MISEKYIMEKTRIGCIVQQGKILAKFYLVASVPCIVDWGDKKEYTELRVPLAVKDKPKTIRDIVGKKFDIEYMRGFFGSQIDDLLAKTKYLVSETQDKKTLNNLTFKELYETTSKK